MRKVIIIFAVLLLVAVGFLVSNILLDGPEPTLEVGEKLDLSNVGAFLEGLFPPPSFDAQNGYYRLWTLIEPAETDIDAPETLERYRKVHDPKLAEREAIKKWGEDFVKVYNKGHYKKINDQRKKILSKNSKWTDPPKNPNNDWLGAVLEETDQLAALEKIYALQLERYDKLIDSPIFEDFTLPYLDGGMNEFAPIPNLLAWLHTAKLFWAVNMRNAAAGDWDASVNRLLDHVDFGKRAVKGSRVLITNLVAKAVLRYSLRAVVSVMNHPDCPATVPALVLQRLTPIQYDEYGSRKSLMAEGFATAHHVSDHFCIQKNRTLQYFYTFIDKLIISEQTPPYQWKDGILENNGIKKGNLWWLQNPIGKNRFHDFLDPSQASEFAYISAGSMNAVVYKSYIAKTLYDMTRIAAAFHMEYTGQQTVRETLSSLQIYKELPDPCTGQPYKLGKNQRLLYSIGTDRVDDGGTPAKNDWKGDIVIPLVPKQQ
jgi:hypothetical protein